MTSDTYSNSLKRKKRNYTTIVLEYTASSGLSAISQNAKVHLNRPLAAKAFRMIYLTVDLFWQYG